MKIRLAIMLALAWGSEGYAVEDAEAVPVPANPPPTLNVHLEFIGRGLIPTARVVINNPELYRRTVSARWTYEVIPQDLPKLAPLTTTQQATASLPPAIINITLDEDVIFPGGGPHDGISIGPRKAWGHDHLLDFRLARLPPGNVFIRLKLTGGNSPFVRYELPAVPNLPLVRFTPDVRKLDDAHFARIAGQADVVVTGKLTSGDNPWCRILTLVASDPHAHDWPQLLIDGKSNHVIGDGELARFALRGVDGERIESDAKVISISPEP